MKQPYPNTNPPNKSFLQKAQTKEEPPKFENHDFPALGGKGSNKTKKEPSFKNEEFPSLGKSNNNNSNPSLSISPNQNNNKNIINHNNNNNNHHNNNNNNDQQQQGDQNIEYNFDLPSGQIYEDLLDYGTQNEMMIRNPELFYQMQQQYQEKLYEQQQQQLHQQQLQQQKQQQNMNNNNNITSNNNLESQSVENGEEDGIQEQDDRYCLIELQPVIRMTNPDLNLLSVGQDLTVLGLELNSRECLYETFVSPWFNESSKNVVPSFMISELIQIAPPNKKFDLFTDESLFYIFYTHTNDILQIEASRELYKRKWRYHKFLQSWIRGGSTDNESSETHQKGTFEFFDTNVWEKITKENFVVENSALEENLPNELQF